MKKTNIYKSALAVLTAGSIILMGGCTGKESDSSKAKPEKPETCTHLTVWFGNETVTFKECEGYEISQYYGYSVFKDGKQLIETDSNTIASYVHIYHDVADSLIDIEAIQKSYYIRD